MAKKYSNIDDLFRDKFKDFELYPPDRIWENIKQQLPQTNSGRSNKNTTNGGIIGIAILLIVTGIFTFYLLQNKDDNVSLKEIINSSHSSDKLSKTVTRSIEIPATQNKNSDVVSSDEPEPLAVKPATIAKQKSRFDLADEGLTQPGKSSLTVSQTVSENSAEIGDQNGVENEKTVSETERISNPNFFIVPGNDTELLALNSSTEPSKKESGSTIAESAELSEESTSASESGYFSLSSPEIRSDYGQQGNWLFGLFFTPEMVFYPSSSDYNNRSYSVDANVIYRFSGYILQSGLGVGWSSDNGNYKIDYNKYLGSYDDVYNVTFDTTGGLMTPIYHTETVKVYDSIDHIYITPTKRHFTYLNIPVLFGYGNEGRRFGWFIKAGPSLSLLVNENIPDINLSDSQDKILGMDSKIPGRIKTNWQFVFSGGAAYKLNNSINFTIEPIFRYYMKSTHETGKLSTKTPYSLGLRVGLMLGF